MAVDPDSAFGIEVLRDLVYEPRTTELLLHLLRPEDVFVDVGGNEGYFSLLAAKARHVTRVHCIEPQSPMHPVLARNIALNRVEVMMHRLALSDHDGPVTLHLAGATNPGATSVHRYVDFGSSETVTGVTLDNFCESEGIVNIRLMKVDCEGAEGLVVSGGTRMLGEGHVEFLVIEYHDNIISREECYSIDRTIRKWGYILTKVRGQYVYHHPGKETELNGLELIRVNCDWLGKPL